MRLQQRPQQHARAASSGAHANSMQHAATRERRAMGMHASIIT
jgi:hypothetical protein